MMETPSPPHTTNPGGADPLRGKIVRGGAWLAGQYALRQGLRFLRVVIVARVVDPSDIGLLGMAALAITLVRVMTETGLQQAVIHQQDESRDTLDTAWTVLLIRNLIIGGAVALGAGAVAHFFDEPRAMNVVRVTSIVLVLEAFINISAVMFQKRLDFRRQAMFLGGSEIIEFIVTVILAFTLRNVWALVYGWIAGAGARVLFSYIAEPRMPRLRLEGPVLRSLIGYGKWLTVSSILSYGLLHGDNILVGRFLGTMALGFYQIAYTVSNLPATAVSHVISSVMFPAYSALQDNRARLGRLYLRSLRSTALLSVPVAALIAALSDVFVPVLLGEKWLPAVPLVQILAIYGLLRSLGATTGPAFMAIGRPDIRVHIQTGQMILFAAVVFPLLRSNGAIGVAQAVTVYALISNIYALWRAARECQVSMRSAVEAAFAPVAIGVVTYGAVATMHATLFIDATVVNLLVLATAGLMVYLGLTAIYDRIRHGILQKDVRDVLESVGLGRRPR